MEERAPLDTQAYQSGTQLEAPNDSISGEERTQPLAKAKQPGTSGRPPTLDDDAGRQQTDTPSEIIMVEETQLENEKD
jgi:hypothetical protein